MVRSCIVYLSFASVSQRLGIVILMIFQSLTLRRVYHTRNSQLVAVNAQRRINDTETSLLILLSDYGIRLWTFPFQRSFQFARIIYYWKKDGTMPSITQTDHARIIIPDLLAIYIRKFNASLITFLHYMICRIHCDYINPQGIRMTRSRHNVESTSQLMSLLYKVMSIVLYKMLKSTRRIKVCRLNKSGGEYLVIYGTQLRVKWRRGGLQKCKCLSS